MERVLKVFWFRRTKEGCFGALLFSLGRRILDHTCFANSGPISSVRIWTVMFTFICQ